MASLSVKHIHREIHNTPNRYKTICSNPENYLTALLYSPNYILAVPDLLGAESLVEGLVLAIHFSESSLEDEREVNKEKRKREKNLKGHL